MDQNLPATLSLLESTPAALNGLLRNLPASWTLANEGPGTWTAEDVVRHLIKMDRVNWLPRVRFLLEHGEGQVFPPMEREPGSDAAGLAELLDRFTAIRAHSLDELRRMNLRPAQLELRGTHPTFGQVTLSELLATWAAHDLTHLHQISRILALQYKEAVGPWIAYLGVLHCEGHSANG